MRHVLPGLREADEVVEASDFLHVVTVVALVGVMDATLSGREHLELLPEVPLLAYAQFVVNHFGTPNLLHSDFFLFNRRCGFLSVYHY